MILLVVAWILFFPVSLLNYFFLKNKKGAFRRTARRIDCFANKEFKPLWNHILIKAGGYQFGRRKETLSSVLGKNGRTNTLTIYGKRVYWILDKLERNHCESSINNNLKKKMVTGIQCLKKYGTPELEKNMTLWEVPKELEIAVVPKKIYCNKDLIPHLVVAFTNLISTGRVKELRTWDGCFAIRKVEGSENISLHSFGLAIDVNSAWNLLGQPSTLSPEFVKCFTDAGWDWGGWLRVKDCSHFQISKI